MAGSWTRGRARVASRRVASRLTVANGERVFVKAIDARRWPHEVAAYRAEAAIAAALPAGVAAPRFHGAIDDERWIVLAFEDVDGTHPGDPWTPSTLDRVLEATATLGRAGEATDRLGGLPRDLPRLGGWGDVDGRPARVARPVGRRAAAPTHRTGTRRPGGRPR